MDPKASLKAHLELLDSAMECSGLRDILGNALESRHLWSWATQPRSCKVGRRCLQGFPIWKMGMLPAHWTSPSQSSTPLDEELAGEPGTPPTPKRFSAACKFDIETARIHLEKPPLGTPQGGPLPADSKPDHHSCLQPPLAAKAIRVLKKERKGDGKSQPATLVHRPKTGLQVASTPGQGVAQQRKTLLWVGVTGVL